MPWTSIFSILGFGFLWFIFGFGWGYKTGYKEGSTPSGRHS